MYINPFIAGALFVIFVEMVMVLGYSLYDYFRK